MWWSQSKSWKWSPAILKIEVDPDCHTTCETGTSTQAEARPGSASVIQKERTHASHRQLSRRLHRRDSERSSQHFRRCNVDHGVCRLHLARAGQSGSTPGNLRRLRTKFWWTSTG